MERINNILNQWCNDCAMRNAIALTDVVNQPVPYISSPGDLS